MTTTSAPAAAAAIAPAARSRAIHAGKVWASIRGSSPTSRAVWTRGSTRTGSLSRPPWPRESAWALTPRSVSRRRISVATGVLPAPPRVRLPTQITGTPGSSRAPPAIRRAVAAAQIQPAGCSTSRSTVPARRPRRYHQRGVGTLMGRAAGSEAAPRQGPARRERPRRRRGLFRRGPRPSRGRPAASRKQR